MSTNFRKQQLEHAMTHDLRNQAMRGQTHPHAQAQFAKGGEQMAALRPAVDKKPRGMERVAFHEVYGVAAKAAPAARTAAGYGVSAKGGGFVVSFEEEFGEGGHPCKAGKPCACGGSCGGKNAATARPSATTALPAHRPRQDASTLRPTVARVSHTHAFERGRTARHVVQMPRLPLYKLGQSTSNPDGSVTWGTCAEAIAAAKQANLTILYLAMMGFAEFDYTKLPFVVVCNDGMDGGTVYPNPTPNFSLAPGCAPGERVFALDEDDMSAYDPAMDFVAQVIASEGLPGKPWVGPIVVGCASDVYSADWLANRISNSTEIDHTAVLGADGTYTIVTKCAPGQKWLVCEGKGGCRSATDGCSPPLKSCGEGAGCLPGQECKNCNGIWACTGEGACADGKSLDCLMDPVDKSKGAKWTCK